MRISNVRVYDLEESIIASGFPMTAMFDEVDFCDYVDGLKAGKYQEAIARAIRLAAAPDGSGHRNFCSGILVSLNVTGSNAWWMQMERYHFVQIVSSQSKMHRLKKMVQLGDMPLVNPATVEHLREWLGRLERGEISEEDFIYECPVGLQLTARITTNYLQLRTIYVQRRNHKLSEWRDFCEWIASLPYARELITLEDAADAR